MRIPHLRHAAAALTAVFLTVGCGSSDTPRTTPTATIAPATPSVTSTPPSTPAADPVYVVARIRLGNKPCGVVITSGRVWVSNFGDGTVRWVDVATDRAGPPIAVGRSPCGLAAGAGAVWVENYGSNTVTRVDATTGRVLATIEVGDLPYDVTYAAGAAWVTDWGSGTVSRIDPTTNKRTVVQTGGQPTGIVAAAGALWVALGRAGTVVRIDPTTLKVTDRLQAGRGAGWTAALGSGVWISNGLDRTVTHIDAARRRVVATRPVGDVPLDGDAAAGSVWIPDRGGNLYRIDPATDAVRGPYRSGAGNPFVIAGSGTTLWVADYAGTDLLRLDLTRLS